MKNMDETQHEPSRVLDQHQSFPCFEIVLLLILSGNGVNTLDGRHAPDSAGMLAIVDRKKLDFAKKKKNL